MIKKIFFLISFLAIILTLSACKVKQSKYEISLDDHQLSVFTIDENNHPNKLIEPKNYNSNLYEEVYVGLNFDHISNQDETVITGIKFEEVEHKFIQATDKIKLNLNKKRVNKIIPVRVAMMNHEINYDESLFTVTTLDGKNLVDNKCHTFTEIKITRIDATNAELMIYINGKPTYEHAEVTYRVNNNLTIELKELVARKELRERKTREIVTVDSTKALSGIDKTVIKREIKDSVIYTNPNFIFTTNHDKFIIRKVGEYKVLYTYTFDDNSTENVIFTYKISKDNKVKKDNLVNKYLQNLVNNKNTFNNKELTVETPKLIGTANEYKPDITYKFTGYQLNSSKTDFEEALIEEELDLDLDVFAYKVLNHKGKDKTTDNIKEQHGSKLLFFETEKPSVLTLQYFFKDNGVAENEPLFTEKIKLKNNGWNAYEDGELRNYFYEVFTIEDILLQRNIKVIDHDECISKDYVLPSGAKINNRLYNSDHFGSFNCTWKDSKGKLHLNEPCPAFDAEGKITEGMKLFQGSIYYRYFPANGTRKNEYKPVKFDGNHYKIDASDLTQCFSVNSYIPVPDIQCGVFDFSGDGALIQAYEQINEVKNVQIVANGGISGEDIDYDNEGKKLSKLSGSILALRSNYSRLEAESVTVKNSYGLLHASASEISLSQINVQNSFSYHIYFRNRIAHKEPGNIPMTRLVMKDSYLGDCGGIGISVADGDRRTRVAPGTNINQQYKFDNGMVVGIDEDKFKVISQEKYTYEAYDKNKMEDRIAFSADPSLELINCDLQCYVSTDSALISTFGIKDQINQVKQAEKDVEKHFKLKFLKTEGTGATERIKINVPLVCLNNNLLDIPVKELYTDGKKNESYFYTHDCPRWDLTIVNEQNKTIRQYYPVRYNNNVSKTVTTALKSNNVPIIISAFGEDYVNLLNGPNPNEPKDLITLAGPITKMLNKARESKQTSMLQITTYEPQIPANGTGELIKLNGCAFIGFYTK